MADLSPILSRFAKPYHTTATQMVLATLTLGDKQAFAGLSVVLRAKLTRAERKGLAWAALRACDDDEVLALSEDILPPEQRVAPPLPPLANVVEEAVFWTGMAAPDELRAYALACFMALSPADQADFLVLAQRRRAA